MYEVIVCERDGASAELLYPVGSGVTLIRDICAAISRGAAVYVHPEGIDVRILPSISVGDARA